MPQIQTDVRDAEALRAACRQLGLPEPVLGAFSLGSAVASGFAVRLSGWRYPVVFQLDTGLVQYDNPHGEQQELDRFLEACSGVWIGLPRLNPTTHLTQPDKRLPTPRPPKESRKSRQNSLEAELRFWQALPPRAFCPLGPQVLSERSF